MLRHGTRHPRAGRRGRADHAAQALAQVDTGERAAAVGLPGGRPDRARARARADALPRSDPAAHRLSAGLFRGGPGTRRRPRHRTGRRRPSGCAGHRSRRSPIIGAASIRTIRSATTTCSRSGTARPGAMSPPGDRWTDQLETLSGQRILNCGVSGTGPRDQAAQGAKNHRQGRGGAEGHPRAVRHLERFQRRCRVSRLRRGRRLSRPHAEISGSAHRRADPPHARRVRGDATAASWRARRPSACPASSPST